MAIPKIYNIHEAKSSLSKLISEIEKGNEVIIGRAGKPVAKLVGYEENQQKRQLGPWKGKVKIADDFDLPCEDIVALFEGD